MTEISEVQKKRAINQIWNGAADHSFTPDFKAYDKNGAAELYWNCIIGAVRKHYDYPRIEKVFLNFQEHEDSDTYEGLLWLGLENAVYHREVLERPVLSKLRAEYAERFVDEFGGKYVDDYHIYDYLSLGHFKRVLNTEPKLSKRSRELLDELEFSPELDTDEIVERAKKLFEKWFLIRSEERKKEKKRLPVISLKKRGGQSRYRAFGIGFADHPDGLYSSKTGNKQKKQYNMRSKLTDAELRRFMTEKYGLPMFDNNQTALIERDLCRDNHSGCKLHFTKGEPIKGEIQNGFEALHKKKEALQIQKNRDYYNDNLARNRTSINRLAEKIQNSILMHLRPAPVKSNSGTINPTVVWRANQLDDDKVFVRSEQDNTGSLSVDILLDASTSQKNRQETVSNQGFMIAESLDRCGIPCRVMSFCSMTGFTILRVFRDYREPRNNKKIFEYVSNGCNRDGLAIRAAHHLMNYSEYEHKILIVLSDVKPNDVVKLRSSGEKEFIPYENDAGLNDTATEVRRARADGISVICVFTGEDEDLPSAKMVYGRDFARIQSLDMLAETVGNLIQNQIKIL